MKKLLLAFGLIATCLVTAFSQGRSVTGVVTSADENSGIPGVTVVEKGTQNATFTGQDVAMDDWYLMIGLAGSASKSGFRPCFEAIGS